MQFGVAGHQAANVTAFRSERIVLTVKRGQSRKKVLQIIFGRDGSLFVNFPYFGHRTGILAAAKIPGNGQRTSEVNFQVGGKIASHLVKYAHHPDGRAHFSQDGKIRTAIKRQSIALDRQQGHIFSVLFQGLDAFDAANDAKDSGVSAKRTVLTFELPMSADRDAMKIVGRWSLASALTFQEPASSIGPIVPTRDPEGQIRNAFLLASRNEHAEHVLLVTCELIPALNSEPHALVFYGGFDAREMMDDTTREAGFLGLIYPAADAEALKAAIGTVDWIAPVP
jgi:hypothetical protein